ncbi:MAG: hypothetical protein C4323_10265 [Mastigocladus sp. ERB_26_2]
MSGLSGLSPPTSHTPRQSLFVGNQQDRAGSPTPPTLPCLPCLPCPPSRPPSRPPCLHVSNPNLSSCRSLKNFCIYFYVYVIIVSLCIKA